MVANCCSVMQNGRDHLNYSDKGLGSKLILNLDLYLGVTVDGLSKTSTQCTAVVIKNKAV